VNQLVFAVQRNGAVLADGPFNSLESQLNDGQPTREETWVTVAVVGVVPLSHDSTSPFMRSRRR